MKTRYFLLLSMLMAATATLWAQAKISNVDALPAGSTIAINYDLSKEASIRVVVSDGMTHQYHRIPNRYLEGDCGRNVAPGTSKRAVWKVLDQKKSDKVEGSMQFKVKAVPAFQPFILASGSYALGTGNWAGGLMAGAVGNAGFYVRGESSFTAMKKCDMNVDASGYVDGNKPFYNGKTASTAWQATGGLIIRMYIPMYIYLGGGYGVRELYWQTIYNSWARNMGYTYRGFTGDIGLMGNIKHVAVSVGVSSIQFKYTTVHVGVGYAF